MNCPSCHSSVDDDSTFCKHCGGRIGQEPDDRADAAAVAAVATTAPLSQPLADPQDVYRDPKFEKQVWASRPSWRATWDVWFGWGIVSLVVLIAAGNWAGVESPLFKTLLLFVAGAAIAIFVRYALMILGLRYRLTTQRLFVHRGILTRVTDQLELMRVDDVRVRQSLFDRLANTGDIEVIGTDETDPNVKIESVSAPAEVAEALRTHVRGVRSKGALMVENI